MRIIVAGGTGFIGKALVRQLLDSGHSVVVLTRNPANMITTHPKLVAEFWDGVNVGAWAKQIDGADTIINVTGELIAGKRWTKKQKELIVSSRLNATNALVAAIGASSAKPSLYINASAVGYYGDVPSAEVPESFPPGGDFLATVCRQWEDAARKAEQSGVRVVTPRIGIVLGEGGGALEKLVMPFTFLMGGYLGSGKQWLPWIHRDDLVQAVLFIMNTPHINGAVNFAAPECVTMKSFCGILGQVLRRPSWTFVPAFALRLMLGEMADMLLTGQRVIPTVLLSAGFTFSYPALEPALTSILRK